ILADTAERLEEIDEARAEEARSRVKQLMARKDSAEKVDFIALAAKMEKELARLKVARKYKNIKQGLQIKIEDE
ncbi:MAG TPA: ATP synthase delta/epsilon chain alpha-helix domain-containing protein, partial [Patescibacteria group bacterium]|nr:ATP synthase delta/epsilon chain alpha-helix domain-containing protein [Patescibacteria group bacterium]